MTMRELLPPLRSLGARFTAPSPTSGKEAGRRTRTLVAPVDVPPLRPRVEIPVSDPGPDAAACAALRARGQFLARQEDWQRLSSEIRRADNARILTPGLHPESLLLSEGARADIAEAVGQAVDRNEPQAVLDVLSTLEDALEDLPDCPAVANVLALAHVDAAQAWRGRTRPEDLPDARRGTYQRHMAKAAALTDRFDPFEHDSPLWAQVRCAILEADPQARDRVADDYEDLIDLDPANPGPLWALGRDLRPARFGSWELLDQQARRTAMRTADVWGTGGYAWVYYGALGADLGAMRRLDAELFVEGLHDILERFPSQDMANRLAAFTGFTLGASSLPDGKHRRLADCLGWIAQDHLREVHPAIWAEASLHHGAQDLVEPGETDPTRLGRARALNSLARYYAPALDAGRRMVFGGDGLRMVKGD